MRSLALHLCAIFLAAAPAAALADPVKILSVDVTPFVSPGPSRYGPQNTMGMALELVDTGGLFDLTEVTPAQFRAMSSAQLAAFDLIALNNHPVRLNGGIGTKWHGVVGVARGGRLVLSSHDAPRFHMNVPPGALDFPPDGPGVEPFGAPELIRQSALWAGGVPGRTGLLVFNDASFFGFGNGLGWNNKELRLPEEWGITDLDPFQSPLNGDGYTDIVPAFEAHPLYALLSDVRFDVNSITSFGGNVTAASFHTSFRSFEAGIFAASEVIANAGDPNPGDLNVPGFNPPAPGLDGRAVALVREAEPPLGPCENGADDDGDTLVDLADPGCRAAYDPSELPDCSDGIDNDGDGLLDHPADDRCDSPLDPSERADCEDGLDNDSDGLIDFPADPGCTSPFMLTELPDCSDGLDNDGDGRADFPADIGCADAASTLENPACNDGLDNDGDGFRDHDGILWLTGAALTAPDPTCGGDASRPRESVRCGLGFEGALALLGVSALRRRRSR